jgi:hypothetical protein
MFVATYIMKVLLLLLVSLKDIKKLFVCIRIISISSFYPVEIVYSMIEFSWRLPFDRVSVVVKIPQDGCSSSCLWILEPGGVGRIERWLLSMMEKSMRSMRARQGVRSKCGEDRWWTWKRRGICMAR